jgi:mannose-1-phosphate guanylyltransferase/phosphomannomutase
MVIRQDHSKTKNPVMVADGQLVEVRGAGVMSPKKPGGLVTAHDFTGIHIISNELIRKLPAHGPCDIWPAYQACLDAGQTVGTYTYDGYWRDIGNPTDYWKAHQELMSGGQTDISRALDTIGIATALKRLKKHVHWKGGSSWFVAGSDVEVDKKAKTSNAAIYGLATVGEHSHISNSIVYQSQKTKTSDSLEYCISFDEHSVKFGPA